MFQRTCKITYISHGATVYSLDGIINNNIKSPKLNEIGLEEMNKLCDFLECRGVSYDNIYSSPYAYCCESANIIAKLFNKKIINCNLKTRNYGDWTGQSFSELCVNDITPLIQTPPNGESIEDFNSRVQETIRNLVEQNKGDRIILVTTPEVIQAAIADTLGLSAENQYKILIKTGSVTQISYFKGWSSLIYSDYKPL